jgi:hypothetical protein
MNDDEDERHCYILQCLRELLYRWPVWGTLDRAEAVVQLRNEGLSLRKLAKTAGCCEGTIRNYEFLGRVPWQAKRALSEGRITMRKLVQAARDAHQEAEQ